MYWKSQTQSPKQKNNSLIMTASNISQRTTDMIRSSTHSDSLQIQSSYTESIDKSMNKLKTSITPIRNKIIQKKMKSINKNQEAKSNYLTKILINKIINIRLAYKLFQTLPLKIFSKGQTFDIAKQIIFKNKLNIQTSILRTLIFAQKKKNDDNKCKLNLQRGQNIFINPTINTDGHKNQQRNAIIKLVQLIKLPIKYATRQFALNHANYIAKYKYISKICSNYQFSRKIAFLMIKILPNAKKHSKNSYFKIKNQQFKIVLALLTKKYSKKTSFAFSCIKICSWNIKFKQQLVAKQLISFAKLRKQQSFILWKSQLAKERKQQMSQNYDQVPLQKLSALKKIFARMYFIEWTRFIKMKRLFGKVARRIGCYSRINQQKSFWRLILNSKK